MRNKLILFGLWVLVPAGSFAADSVSTSTDSSAADSLMAKPHIGPLGMDDMTGLSLYLAVLLLLVLSIYLWRKSMIVRRNAS
jgi:hypothetical protein